MGKKAEQNRQRIWLTRERVKQQRKVEINRFFAQAMADVKRLEIIVEPFLGRRGL